MSPISVNLQKAAKRYWPSKQNTAKLVAGLKKIDSAAKFKSRLESLKQQGDLDKVFAWDSKSPDNSLLKSLIKNGKNQALIAYIQAGALEQYPKDPGIDPLEMFIKKNKGVGLSSGRGSPRLREEIHDITLLFMRSGFQAKEFFESDDRSFLYGKHPVIAAKEVFYALHQQNEATVPEENTSLDVTVQAARTQPGFLQVLLQRSSQLAQDTLI